MAMFVGENMWISCVYSSQRAWNNCALEDADVGHEEGGVSEGHVAASR